MALASYIETLQANWNLLYLKEKSEQHNQIFRKLGSAKSHHLTPFPRSEKGERLGNNKLV